MSQIVPVILAGGTGSRLWPLSREEYPKQFLKLLDNEQSLFQKTLDRLTGIEGLTSPLLVCSEEHRFLVAEQLRQLGLSDASILLEPVGRNTAPAVGLAAYDALAEYKDPTLLVLPADHLIDDKAGFQEAVRLGDSMAAKGHLVTFGVEPTRPETGYGYILKKDKVAASVFAVESFVEKPDEKTAKTYLESGDYCWNSGMFMFKASVFLQELKSYAPDIEKVCERSFRSITRDMDFQRISTDIFTACRSESIDYAVMEKTDRAVVVPLSLGWSDVGAWDAVADASEKDAQGNICLGDVVENGCQASYLRSESRMVAGVGLDNVLVIETPDVVLVADRSKAQSVKVLVESLKKIERPEVSRHTQVFRPWGDYESIVTAPRFQAKKIRVNPGASLSLQLHHHRAEHWVVVKGCAKVTRGDEVFQLNEDESTYIPIGTKHRLENPGVIPLELIEIQTGSYLGEDDIVRFEDIYGRNTK